MLRQLSESVSVVMSFDAKLRRVRPLSLTFGGQNYPILNVGLHHTYLTGTTLQHVFSVVSQSLFFRLRLDTSSLDWTLEEISDGLPD